MMEYQMESVSKADESTPVQDHPDFAPPLLKRSSATVDVNTRHNDQSDFVAKSFNKKSRTQTFLRAVNPRRYSKQISSLPDSPGDVLLCENTLRRLREAITGIQKLDDTTDSCWMWYVEYLDNRISQVWQPIVVRVVNDLDLDSSPSSPMSRKLVYSVLIQIATLLEQDKKQPSLWTIVNELRSKGITRPECGHLATAFVFQATGWLTAFWDPALDTSEDYLTLSHGGNTTRRFALHSAAVTERTRPMKEERMPLYQFLRRFGTLLPLPLPAVRDTVRGSEEAGLEVIRAKYLSFHNLQEDLNVRIKWTRTLNQHLELDQRNKILYVFQFPSLCRLMYRCEPGTLFSHIYREYVTQYASEEERYSRTRNMLKGAKIESYFMEVLLSYDIIFGRSRHSRARAQILLSEVKEEWTAEGIYDPLLETLCTKDSTFPVIKELHKYLEAGDFQNYIPSEEFIFLGERLVKLQKLSESQHPHSLRRLWNDRRNIGTWFALWAVIIFGGASLILQGLALLFQVLQVWTPK